MRSLLSRPRWIVLGLVLLLTGVLAQPASAACETCVYFNFGGLLIWRCKQVELGRGFRDCTVGCGGFCCDQSGQLCFILLV